MCASVEHSWKRVSVCRYFGSLMSSPDSLLIIHDWMSGILTMGETPYAAMTGTSSCMAASSSSVRTYLPTDEFRHSIPSILPCSQSTQIQSGLALARTLETLVPGTKPRGISDCHERGAELSVVHICQMP